MLNFEKLADFNFGSDVVVNFSYEVGEDIRADYEDYKEDLVRGSETFWGTKGLGTTGAPNLLSFV